MKHAWFTKFTGIILAVALAAGCENKDPQRPVPNPIDDSAELIQVLAGAYRALDYPTFATLFCTDYLFILDEPNPETNETQWDLETELRIHRRMFNPQSIPPGDQPLPPEVWVQSISITLSLQNDFVERPELYTTYSPPGSLDPALWIARGATYGTDVFFQLQGETDYQVTGRADFTVLEDRTKQIGDAGKFCIYRWEDLGTSFRLVEESTTWSRVKGLYS